MPSPTTDSAELGRWYALLIATAAFISSVSLIADLTPDRHRGLTLAVTMLAFPTAIAMHRFGSRISIAAYARVAVPAGVTQLAVGIWLSGNPVNPAAVFFIMAMFYSAYFFTRRIAAVHLVVVGVAYGTALLLTAERALALDWWWHTVGVAALIAAVISALRDQLLERASVDSLTGVLNRRAFEERLAAELADACAQGRSLGLLFVDIDHFKQLNDGRGHAVGDAALRAVAGGLGFMARGPARVGRLGGDEFAVLLPDADRPACERCGAEVGRRLRDTTPGLTLSVGVATAPLHGSTPTELLEAADRALYDAKRGGRDRVAVASTLVRPAA